MIGLKSYMFGRIATEMMCPHDADSSITGDANFDHLLQMVSGASR